MKAGNSTKKQLLLQFYRNNKMMLFLAIIASLSAASLNLIISWIMRQLIDTASGVNGSMPLRQLIMISIGFIVFCIAVYLLRYISEPKFIERALKQYKDLAFKKLTEKSISSFQDESTATYLSALTNDSGNIETEYLVQQLSLFQLIVNFIGALIMMLWYSPLMTAIAVGFTILPLVGSIIAGDRLQVAERKVSDRNRDFTASLSDCLGGFSVVKSFRAEKEIYDLFASFNRALEHEKFSKRRLQIMVGMLGAITGVTAQIGVFIAGAYLSISGHGLTPGTVILFVNLMNFMIQPVSEFPVKYSGIKAGIALVGKLADALDSEGDSFGTEDKDALTEKIEFDNVSFSYDKENEILHSVSAVFEKGRSYAIVGGSGSGKSTFLNLLTGSGISRYGGKINIDDTDLRDISPESLYRMISVIQQNVFVFNATIRDNLTMFKDFPDDEIRDAIEKSRLADLITDRGSDYLCGENGKGLSGGEKQRISIGRSLLKRYSVILADEITSALDKQTSFNVLNDMLSLNGITKIVITHSLDESILSMFDEILVFKEGRIVESGTFSELMENRDYFYALYTVSQ